MDRHAVDLRAHLPLAGIARASDLSARAYLAVLLAGAAVIALEHVFLPSHVRAPLVAQLAGADYASRQVPAFDAHRGLMVWHSLLGLLFIGIVPLQFSPRFRRRHRLVHRVCGVVFVVAATGLAGSGIAVAVMLPFAGRSEVVPNAFFGLLLCGCLFNAVRAALGRRYASHRDWMLRAVAIGAGIALARVYIAVFVNVMHLSSAEALGQAFWLGSGTSLLLMEIWVNLMRVSRVRA